MTNRRQAIIWTNADSIHWRIYAALGEDELTKFPESIMHYILYFVTLKHIIEQLYFALNIRAFYLKNIKVDVQMLHFIWGPVQSFHVLWKSDYNESTFFI